MKKTFILFAAVLGIAAHAQLQSWSLTGNTGTTPENNFIGTTDNQSLVFKTNGSEKMRITPGGRLIFLDTPSMTYANNLYIGGGNDIPSNSGAGLNYGNLAVGIGALISNTTGYANTALGYGSLNNNTTGAINTAVGINSMQASVTGLGNVSIGHNSLSGLISGDGNTAIGASALRTWGSLADIPITGNTAVGNTALLRLNDGTNNTVIGLGGFLNTKIANNNIAIGVNNAPNAENAKDNIYIGNNIIPFRPKPANELNIGNWITGNNGTIGIGHFTNVLPADGIAPDGQKYKLFVKDGIRTEKVKVDIAEDNGWADYVFEKDYKLMPLNELAQFIDKNGHLPEVPTTEQAIKNGIELKEMNILLLKKIEELTLYTLEQQKRIEAMEKKLK